MQFVTACASVLVLALSACSRTRSASDSKTSVVQPAQSPHVVSAKGVLYYAASNNYSGGQSQFGKVNPDNTGKQTLLTAPALNALGEAETAFAIEVLRKLPEQVVRENWPYGVIL